MKNLCLKNFYKHYINLFLKNKLINHTINKINNNKIFKNNKTLKDKFFNIFFFINPYFQNKLLFIYKRKIWLILKKKNLSKLEKIEIWNICQIYLKSHIFKFLIKIFKINDYREIFKVNNNQNDKIVLKQLISDLNKIFLFKGFMEKNSIKSGIHNYRFNLRYPISIFNTTLGFFSKKRLKLFNIRNEFNKKYDLNLKSKIKPYSKYNKYNKFELNYFLQKKFNDFKRNVYLTTAFLVIKLKLNNIFLTALNYKGDTIYQCSGGFYNNKGQKRMLSNTISNLSHRLSFELKRMHNIDKIIILYKTAFTNKLIKSTIYGLKNMELSLLGSIYCYNRPTTFLKKRKTRRV